MSCQMLGGDDLVVHQDAAHDFGLDGPDLDALADHQNPLDVDGMWGHPRQPIHAAGGLHQNSADDITLGVVPPDERHVHGCACGLQGDVITWLRLADVDPVGVVPALQESVWTVILHHGFGVLHLPSSVLLLRFPGRLL